MKTVFFDLDGTLLPMDQDIFLKAYFGSLATKMVPYGYEPQQMIKGIWYGNECMVKNDGRCTNEEAFWKGFEAVIPNARNDESIFEDFYHKEFQFVSASCGFEPRAAEIIAYLKERGCSLVLATNPVFPALATMRRIQWAGLKAEDFRWVTTFENAHFCKPNLMYYQELIQLLALDPSQCIMIGNDVAEDMVAKQLGMDVFLLTDHLINKQNEDISQFPHGSYPELMAFLEKAI